MTDADVIDSVYRLGDFDSREQAERVTHATLRTLGTCLSTGEARDVAEYLPPALSEALVDVERGANPMAYEEFLDTVREEAGVEGRDVEHDARVVVAVLAGRVGGGELSDAQAQLPPNYGRLFDVEPAAVGRPFVDVVSDRVTFESPARAATVTRAVLETLGERLSRGESRDVSRYLEGDAERWIVDYESPDAAEFSVEEFVNRVARQADVSEEMARESIRAVVDAIGAVAPSHELANIRAQLPAEYDSVFAFSD